MDVQDFLIQGDGSEEDKREAWQLFQQAYEQQMKGLSFSIILTLIISI